MRVHEVHAAEVIVTAFTSNFDMPHLPEPAAASDGC